MYCSDDRSLHAASSYSHAGGQHFGSASVAAAEVDYCVAPRASRVALHSGLLHWVLVPAEFADTCVVTGFPSYATVMTGILSAARRAWCFVSDR